MNNAWDPLENPQPQKVRKALPKKKKNADADTDTNIGKAISKRVLNQFLCKMIIRLHAKLWMYR